MSLLAGAASDAFSPMVVGACGQGRLLRIQHPRCCLYATLKRRLERLGYVVSIQPREEGPQPQEVVS